jgi:hypothetical protein
MRKLEDIPKKTPFTLPEGYFDHLPTVIQSRMAKEARRTSTSRLATFSLKFVLPIVALVVAGIFWFRSEPWSESPLADVDTEQIALYLTNAERLDLDETNEANGWTKQELDELEDTVYSNMDYSNEDILDDIDLENL